MKHAHFLGWEPMLRWNQSKIRVHWFYCVPAPILASFSNGALPGLSLNLPALCNALAGIQGVANVYPATGKPGSPGRPRLQSTLPEIDLPAGVLRPL